MCGKLLGYKWICLLVQLPLSSPTYAGPRLVGHVQPPCASGPCQLWILSIRQHVQVLQYTEHSKEQDVCEQLPGRQRWVETFAFFYEHIAAAGRSLFTVDKTTEENKGGEEACVCICKGLGVQGLFTTAASFTMVNFSRRIFLLAKKITSEHLVVPSCTEQSRNVIISLINSSKWYLKCRLIFSWA